MQELITPFHLTYGGLDADEHVMEATKLGQSIVGASKLYTSVAHYCIYGYVPRGNYKKYLVCRAGIPREGSYDTLYLIGALAQQNLPFAGLAKDAASQIFFSVVGAIKKDWIGGSSSEAIVKELSETIREMSKQNTEVQNTLASGIVRANDNLASLQERLIDTLPKLAELNRTNGKQLVTPVGSSCREITQFSGLELEDKINEPEAAAIRSDDLEVGDMKTFKCISITEINTNTGHCEMVVEGLDGVVKGKITDPSLKEPGNIYTKSLDKKSSFSFTAKPTVRNGQIERLFISDARGES